MSQTKAQLISDLVQALNFTGTASAPANGLFLSAANTLKLATASTERLKIDGTEVVVNDTGASVDFRIEGDTDANLFKLDASADKVGIGESAPDAKLEVKSADSTYALKLTCPENVSGSYNGLSIAGADENAGSYPLVIVSNTTDTHETGGHPILCCTQRKVGIGTLTPHADLHVQGDGTNAEVNIWGGTLGRSKFNLIATDTGSAGRFQLTTESTVPSAPELITVTNAGNVGIATTSPSEKLDVSGEIQLTNFLKATGDLLLCADIDNNNEGTAIRFLIDGDSSSDELMRIKSDGNVGIGTTSPGQKLHIHSGSSSGALNIQSNGSNNFIAAVQSVNNFITGAAAGSLAIRSSDGIYFSANDGSGVTMAMLTSGNVGIATTSPEEILDLGNDVQINLKIGGRGYIGQAYSTAATIIGHSVKAKTTGTTSGGMIITETNSGGGAPSAIRMQSGNIEFHTAASGTQDADFNSNERVRIDSNGRLMIGTTTPGAVLSLDNTGQDTLSLIQCKDAGGSGAHSHIILQNTTGDVATINTVGDNLEFRVDDATVFSNISGTEHAQITSSGRVGINSGGAPLDIPATAHDTVVIGNNTMTSGGVVLHGAADTSGNLGYQFYKGGSFPCARVLYEGSSNELQFHSTSTAAGTAPAAESRKVRILPGGDVLIDDGDLVLASGHGIEFHNYGTGTNITSNLLDDYEEGTFTPLLSDNISSGSAASYQNQSGHYTKIGNIVHVIGGIRADDISNMTSSANLKLRGFPFVVADVTTGSGEPDMLHITFFNNLTTDSNRGFIFGRMENGVAAANIGKFDNSVQTGANLLFSEINSGGASFFSFSATYRV